MHADFCKYCHKEIKLIRRQRGTYVAVNPLLVVANREGLEFITEDGEAIRSRIGDSGYEVHKPTCEGAR